MLISTSCCRGNMEIWPGQPNKQTNKKRSLGLCLSIVSILWPLKRLWTLFGQVYNSTIFLAILSSVKVPFNSIDEFFPPSILYMKYLPLLHNTSGPKIDRKYMPSAVIYRCIYIFVFHPCVPNLVRLTSYSKTLTCFCLPRSDCIISFYVEGYCIKWNSVLQYRV